MLWKKRLTPKGSTESKLKERKMKKEYQVIMIVKCDEGAQNHIAQSVCDGLEEPTSVKYIKVEEIKK